MTRVAMYEKHIGLADRIARDYWLPGADHDDVRQEARVALWIATGSHDPSKSSFQTFARLVVNRRLVTALKAALAQHHLPLNEAVTIMVDSAGQTVPILDVLEGGRDPADVVVALESVRRLRDAIAALSPIEQEAIGHIVSGVPYRGNKKIDNAAMRAKKKLREIA